MNIISDVRESIMCIFICRREDLISFLCGRSPPHRSSVSSRSSKPSSPYTGNATRADGNSENDFQKFQEALSMHGEIRFNCIFQNASVSYRNGSLDVQW